MSVRSQAAVKRTVRSLSVQEKIRAIDRVHEGESKASVARDIGVPESTLRGWCKGEEKLRNAYAQSDTSPPPSSKTPCLENDGPLDFSIRELEKCDNKPKVSSYPVRVPTIEENLQESPSHWTQRGLTFPSSPLEGHAADNSASWFWKWYKTNGVLPQTTPTAGADSQNSDKEDVTTAADAVFHGEKFLRWLENCSDPNVTAVHILQFRHILNNVKESAERSCQTHINKDRSRK